MNSEENKQTNIYNFFANNKRNLSNNRDYEDKYSTELLKKQIKRRDKNNSNKNNNFKIKDYFTFREYPEEVNEIQRELNAMNILCSSNNNKTGVVNGSNFSQAVNSFNLNIDEPADISTKTINNSLNNINNFSFANNTNVHSISKNINNNTNYFANLGTKEKKQSYGINKYFPILESKEEKNLFIANNMNNPFHSSIDNSNSSNNNYNNEVEKVFTLDHFSNKVDLLASSENKLQIELNHSLEGKNKSRLLEYNNKIQDDIKNTCNNSKKDSNLSQDIEMQISKNSTENPFIAFNKSKYQDTKITKYINIIDPPNMKLNRELLVNVLEFIDLRHLIKKVPIICKFWNDLYNKTISSPSYNMKVDFTDTSKISEKEIEILFRKAKNLKHIKLLKEIIAEDFGGNKGIENFYRKIALIMTLADHKEIHHKGVMLNSFKLRPRRPNEMHNFISTKSINSICEASKYSLKTLVLRNCSKLSNKVFDGISSCIFLQTLEISFNDIIDDAGLLKLSEKCKDLKSINLTHLTKITEIGVRAISMNLLYLESIDLSECPLLTGCDIYYLKNLKNLKLILLKNIKCCDNEMIFLEYLKNLNTLSISSIYFSLILDAQNFTDGCLEMISKKCPSLVNLDFTRNSNFTEERIYKFIIEMPNLINFKFDDKYKSYRIEALLRQRLRNSKK